MPLPIERSIFLGQNVLEAERVVTPDKLPYVLPAGYNLLFNFQGNDIVTDVDVQAQDDKIIPTLFLPFGFVAAAATPSADGTTDVIVAIRGTESVWEWIQDARFLMTQFPFVPDAGNTEDGFTAVYSSLGVKTDTGLTRLVDALQAAIAPLGPVSITVSGHSLGSALATLLGIEIASLGLPNLTVITFASPCVGDAAFVARYNALVPNSWRIANQVDIVTHLPPSIFAEFEQVNTVYQMNFFGKVQTSLVCFHAMTSYLHFLSLLTSEVQSIPLDSKCDPTLPFGL
ncbi:MAG: lipase family protein [Capsulimonadaceae bacterium]